MIEFGSGSEAAVTGETVVSVYLRGIARDSRDGEGDFVGLGGRKREIEENEKRQERGCQR